MMSERAVFAGPPLPLPGADEMPRRWAEYRPESESPTAVHHAVGYDAFVELLRSRGHGVRELARRPDLLLPVVRDLAGLLAADPVLRRSAAIFWGNAMVATRGNAAWQPQPGDGSMVGDGGRGISPSTLIDLLVGVRTAADAGVSAEDFPAPEQIVEKATELLHGWTTDPPWVDPIAALPQPAVTPDLIAATAGYRRPAAVDVAIVEDARRYPPRAMGAMPREDEYSVATHVERYRPLHDVADALVAYLVATFACSVRDAGGEPLGPTARGVATSHATLRDVIVSTGMSDRAELRFRFTDYPSVVLRAGVFTEIPAPTCGCDACDESLEHEVEGLEWTVLTVAGGGFTERLSRDGTERTTRLVGADRSSSGTSFDHVPPADLDAVLARLAVVPGGWRTWPRR
ncbi:DUF6226 family protein [Tersicoccus sp. MR15.9]|uniref:DUF6226 family protein n=1 Tax=Tersicoccus mangrovi TaxID=3121635 RepID=UPI002FE64FC6